MCATRCDIPLIPASLGGPDLLCEVSHALVLNFLIKHDDLPRQARDKYEENSKAMVFSHRKQSRHGFKSQFLQRRSS